MWCIRQKSCTLFTLSPLLREANNLVLTVFINFVCLWLCTDDKYGNDGNDDGGHESGHLQQGPFLPSFRPSNLIVFIATFLIHLIL